MKCNIVINADDFGYTVDISKTIIDFLNKGYCDTATVMVNCPKSLDSYRLAEQAGVIDRVGLHINLTNGTPLTSDIAKCASICRNGQFGVYKAHKDKRFILTVDEREAVKAEIRAQVEEYLKLGYKGMTMDSHQGIHMDWSIYPIVLEICKEYSFIKVRRSPNIHTDVIRRMLHTPFDIALRHTRLQTTDYMGSIKDFVGAGLSIPAGKSVEIMCHPQSKQGILYVDETLGYRLNDYLDIVSNKRKDHSA